MRFGSVAFFKALIKIVLAILFFVPLVLCIVFAVMLHNQGEELDRLSYENQVLTYKSELLSGEIEPSVEGFYGIYSISGFSDQELIDYISEKNTENAPEDTQASSQSVSQIAPQTSSPIEETAHTESAEAADTAESAEESYEPEIIPVISSEYSGLFADMVVTPPDEYVREEGMIYLTFDDGPSENTLAILNYLDKYDIKATFFVVPQHTDECYSLMSEITTRGHSIGVHSASHDYEKIYSSVEAFLADFNEAWNMIYEATGIVTEVFRFPGGSKNDYNQDTRDAIINEMTRRGFRFFDWNVDSNDIGGATWTDMYNSVPSDIAGNFRSVVLMHDSAPTTNTVYVLEDILKLLKDEGYSFDSIHRTTRPVQFIGPFA